jgi:hypothetical protein
LKKPDATNFSKKNIIHPFEDPSSLEFFSEKQDASLFVVGSHSKKRPNNLTFARMFEHKLLDMMEFGVLNYKPCSEFKVPHANSIPSFRRSVLTSLESRGDSWLTTPPDLLWRLI